MGVQKVQLVIVQERPVVVVVEQVDMVLVIQEGPHQDLLVVLPVVIHHHQVGEILAEIINTLQPIIMVVVEVVVPDLPECLEKLQQQPPHKVI